ncbi:MAG: NERD domain-containing protein [Lachnospiraceae bacterium]|nr:NERD domain-containing protein [Lachnospiraceae bacterium]
MLLFLFFYIFLFFIAIAFIVGIVLIAVFVHKKNVENYKQTDYYQDTQREYSETFHNKGNYGEYMLYNYVQKYVSEGAKLIFNCYLPKDNGETTEVDMIMLHSSGIYVFESKNYSGWIFGSEYQNNWTQTFQGGRRGAIKEHFFNPVIQNKVHIKWIENILGEGKPIYSVIVFSERCTLQEINISSSDIYVVKRNELTRCIDDIKARKGLVLSDYLIQYYYDLLHPYSIVDKDTKDRHINKIKEREMNNIIADAQINAQIRAGDKDNLRCPRCGGKLVLRTAQRGAHAGNQFYGCSNYPNCKFVKNI